MKSTRYCKTIAILQFYTEVMQNFLCIGQIFPPDRDQFMTVIFYGVLGQCRPFSQKFSETINTLNCAYGQLRG